MCIRDRAILKTKRKGGYKIVAIDPSYQPAPVEHKDVFGLSLIHISMTTGRWVLLLSMGTAEMSSVLRMLVSNVRMPRSHLSLIHI